VFHQLHDAVRAEGILSFIEEGVDEYRTDLSQFLHDHEDMTTSLNSHDIVVVTAISHSMSAGEGFMLADYTVLTFMHTCIYHLCLSVALF